MTNVRTFYVAGWNIPGCLPEMEPATFNTEAEAEFYIHEERERFNNDCPSEDDPYTYWVDAYRPETPYEAYRLACECENLDAHSEHMWRVHGCPDGPI